MTPIGRDLASLRAEVDALRQQLEDHAGRLPDAELITAIECDTATPTQIRRLAKHLRPFVRGYLYRLALGFWGSRQRGERLAFGPFEPMECAAVICSYLPDEEPIAAVLGHLSDGPFYEPDLWAKRSHTGSVHLGYLNWIHGVVVREAIGETTCLEMRHAVAEMVRTGQPVPELLLVPGQRELDLVAPTNIPRFGFRYNLISADYQHLLKPTQAQSGTTHM